MAIYWDSIWQSGVQEPETFPIRIWGSAVSHFGTKLFNFTESVDKKIRGLCSDSIYLEPLCEHIILRLHKMNRSTLPCLTALDSLSKYTKQMCFLSSALSVLFFHKEKNNAPPLVFARLKAVYELMETPPHNVGVYSPSQIMQMEGAAKARYYGNIVLVSLTEILLIYILYNLFRCGSNLPCKQWFYLLFSSHYTAFVMLILLLSHPYVSMLRL